MKRFIIFRMKIFFVFSQRFSMIGKINKNSCFISQFFNQLMQKPISIYDSIIIIASRVLEEIFFERRIGEKTSFSK